MIRNNYHIKLTFLLAFSPLAFNGMYSTWRDSVIMVFGGNNKGSPLRNGKLGRCNQRLPSLQCVEVVLGFWFFVGFYFQQCIRFIIG